MSPGNRIAPAFLALACALSLFTGILACGRPTGVPEPSPADAQRLPFDRAPGSNGISPTQSIPASARLPEGTLLAVRLHKPLSSASSHSGDSFEGVLDDAIVVDGTALIARGATVAGRVLEARDSISPDVPGHLRITLISVEIAGKISLIETSSVFLKAGSRSDRNQATTQKSQTDIVIPTDRRLTFRLAQPIELK